MKIIIEDCPVCKVRVDLRVVLIGQFYVVARCVDCQGEFYLDKEYVDIVESE